jgi:alpha-beta hydrolase superfamily lysophospholipase
MTADGRSAERGTDILGPPYTFETLELPDDDEGRVVATLVHRPASPGTDGRRTTRAVLHVHGFADYFFQTAYAEWWTARGYDFYALDLRKYGRSILPHQTPNYITDLAHHHPELDLAWDRVTAGHRHVVLSGHSTGGLIVPLWADSRRVEARAVVLNAPWFDLQGKAWMRLGLTPLVEQVARRAPRRIVPRTVTGLYARSLHRDHEGEWDFDLSWKPIESWPAYAGWLAAIRRGHADLHRGLSLPFPALVLSSTRSSAPTELDEDVHSTDIVLDVEQIRRWSPALGHHVTYVGIEGARHDVFLSRAEPRARAFDELGRWATAYVDGPGGVS